METSWFVEIRDEELIKFLEEQENPNTKRKTVYDVELFNNFNNFIDFMFLPVDFGKVLCHL